MGIKLHKSQIIFLGILMLGLFIQACAPKKIESQADCGYVQNVHGERISWKGSPINLSIHSTVPVQYHEPIRSAVEKWNQAAGRPLITLSLAPPAVGGVETQKDGHSIIYFYGNWEAEKSAEQARTSVYWTGNKIFESDIKINGKNFQYYWGNSGVGVNLEALVLHEIGHVIGLKHKDQGGSVMATYLANNSDRVQIATTDLESLKCEY